MKFRSKKVIFSATVMAFLILGMALFYGWYLPNYNEAYYPWYSSHRWNNAQEKDKGFIELFDSYETAIASLSATPEKIWDYDDRVYFLDCDYTKKTVLLYYLDREGDKYLLPERLADLSAPGDVLPYEDRHCIDTTFANDIMSLIFSAGKYIDGNGQYNDVIIDSYCGEDIKDLNIGVGEFNYEKLWYDPKIGEDVYLATYELKDMRSLLESACINVENNEYSTKVEYRLVDIVKALQIKAKVRFQPRIIIYLIVLISLLFGTSIMLIKTFRLWMGTNDRKLKTYLSIVISGVLICISIFAILYLVYNPELTFGRYSVNGIIHSISGKWLDDIHYSFNHSWD